MISIPIDDDNVVALGAPFKAPQTEKFLVVGPMKCYHHNGPFVVDESLMEVVCKQCGEKLNPVWVLKQLAHKESRWVENRHRYQDEMQRLAERSRTKCEHCNEMTKISRS